MHFDWPLATGQLKVHLNTRCKPDPYCSHLYKDCEIVEKSDKESVFLVSACILTTHTGMPVTFLSHFHLWPKGTQAYLQGKHFSKTSLCLTVWSSGMYWQKSYRDVEPSEWSIVSASLSASVNNLQCCFPLLMQSALTFTCTARDSQTDPPSKLLLFQLCWTY